MYNVIKYNCIKCKLICTTYTAIRLSMSCPSKYIELGRAKVEIKNFVMNLTSWFNHSLQSQFWIGKYLNFLLLLSFEISFFLLHLLILFDVVKKIQSLLSLSIAFCSEQKTLNRNSFIFLLNVMILGWQKWIFKIFTLIF